MNKIYSISYVLINIDELIKEYKSKFKINIVNKNDINDVYDNYEYEFPFNDRIDFFNYLHEFIYYNKELKLDDVLIEFIKE